MVLETRRRGLRYSVALLVVMALIATACSDSGDAESTTTTEANSSTTQSGSDTTVDSGSDTTTASEPDTVTIAHDKPTWDGTFEQIYGLAANAINVEVDATSYSDGDAYQAFIRQSFRTDETPDMFSWWTGGRLQELVAEGVLAPSTDIWTDAIAAGNVSADLAEYFTVDGEQYCVPLFSAYSVIYYSKPAFDRIGAEPPATWDEFITILDTMVAEGITPIMAQESIFSYIWFQSLMAGSDPDLYFGISNGSASWTDPGVLSVMELWQDMYEGGYFTPAGSFSGEDAAAGFRSGDLGMLNFPTWWNGAMKGMELNEDVYGVFLLPAVNPGLSNTPVVVESGPLCAAANSENAEASAEYMAFYMSTEAQQTWADEQGDVSFNPNAVSSDPVLAPLGPEIGSGGYQLIDNFFSTSPAAISSAANSAFEVFIADPSTDLNSLLEGIEQQAADYWADQG